MYVSASMHVRQCLDVCTSVPRCMYVNASMHVRQCLDACTSMTSMHMRVQLWNMELTNMSARQASRVVCSVQAIKSCMLSAESTIMP
jgi:hypothetical protein